MKKALARLPSFKLTKQQQPDKSGISTDFHVFLNWTNIEYDQIYIKHIIYLLFDNKPANYYILKPNSRNVTGKVKLVNNHSQVSGKDGRFKDGR